MVTVFYALYHVTTAKTQPVDLIENTFRREEVLYLACNEDRTFFTSEEHTKYNFINKGIDFNDLPSIFRDNTVKSSIPDYFANKEPPIICYKYNKPIRIIIWKTQGVPQ